MLEKEFLKSVKYNRNSYVYIWYLVASWACEAIRNLTQKRLSQCYLCEYFNDLTSPTSNQYI